MLGAVDDPKLPLNAVDLVLLVDVYHEFSEPQAMLRRIRESLRKDGRLVLLEYRAEDPSRADPAGAQNVRRAGEGGARARGLPPGTRLRGAAAPAHSDLSKKSLTCLEL